MELQQDKIITKSELRDWFFLDKPIADENAFRRELYHLEKTKTIIPLDQGFYHVNPQTQMKHFLPTVSKENRYIYNLLQDSFPYLNTMLWQTRDLYPFMQHIPEWNATIISVEKDGMHSVFDKLQDEGEKNIFLDPDQSSIDLYASTAPECTFVLQLISQSPPPIDIGYPHARIEQILVDILVDQEPFFIFQNSEMVTIWQNVFNELWVNPKTIMNYAKRRSAAEKVKTMVRNTGVSNDFF